MFVFKDVLEPVGSPAVLSCPDGVSNLPLLGCPFFVHNSFKGGNRYGQSK